jgi:hypothetical protein
VSRVAAFTGGRSGSLLAPNKPPQKRFAQDVAVDRFGESAADPGARAGDLRIVGRTFRQHDDGNAVRTGQAADAARRLDAVHDGHVHIQQNCIVGNLLDPLHGLSPRSHVVDPKADAAKHRDHRLTRTLIIFGQQDAPARMVATQHGLRDAIGHQGEVSRAEAVLTMLGGALLCFSERLPRCELEGLLNSFHKTFGVAGAVRELDRPLIVRIRVQTAWENCRPYGSHRGRAEPIGDLRVRANLSKGAVPITPEHLDTLMEAAAPVIGDEQHVVDLLSHPYQTQARDVQCFSLEMQD